MSVHSDPHVTPVENFADTLRWQARYRMLFASLIGFSAVTLKWFGVVSAESVLLSQYGARDILLMMVGLVLAYVLGHRVLLAIVTRRGRARLGLAIGAIASDVVILYGSALLITPPEHYGRALLLSIFTVQFTQIFFG